MHELRCIYILMIYIFVSDCGSDSDRVKRQLSVSSDSKLLDDDIMEGYRVIFRKNPPRPKSEVFLSDAHPRRTKRFSAFGVRSYLLLYIDKK